MRITLTVEVDPNEWRAERGPCDDVRLAAESELLDRLMASEAYGGSPLFTVVRLSGKSV